MFQKIKTYFVLPFLIICLFVLLIIVSVFWKGIQVAFSPPPIPSQTEIPFKEFKGIKKFGSEEEFKKYLEEGKFLSEELVYGELPRGGPTAAIPVPLYAPAPFEIGKGGGPERVSETTVQVPGIDEPDIVKTDGKEIYFSPGRTWPIIWRQTIPEPTIFEKRIIPPYPYKEPETKIIKAFPPSDLAKESEIKESGDLLLIKDKNILVIFSTQEIQGYDVLNPKSPQKKWEAKLNNTEIVATRLYNNKIYLVTKNFIDEIHPCPIKPLFIEGKEVLIPCSEIYHPLPVIPVDVTFSAMAIDPISGAVEKKISFVGSSGNSIVYMSKDSLYITYPAYESPTRFYFLFLKEKCQDLIPPSVLEKIEKLENYEISQQAKNLELGIILDGYYRTLDKDERLKLENELENRATDYFKEKIREFEKTGIIKIGIKDFEIKATGKVPGYPLNQFALDEYEKNLRIATTVGERSWWFRFGPSRIESANDVYILDEKLNILGSVQNLGLTERIYSVRFIEDKGYVVTFRETDPFYVLDLKVATNPQLRGELKIPGYSAYLHPITKDKILGIGKENWQVKISLFNVTDPANPKEIDKYILDENWSDILNTHHAFLLDEKHQIFFLPGSKGGYVFSYKDDKLSLVKAISQVSAKRAIYIEDYLYIISDNKITVLNENTWEKIKDLEI